MSAKTSPALAKLAADYLNLTREEAIALAAIRPAAFAANIRKLAASVLRQVEKDAGK